MGGGYDWSQPSQEVNGEYQPTQEGISPYEQMIRNLSYGMENPLGDAETKARMGQYYDAVSGTYQQQKDLAVRNAIARGQSGNPAENQSLAYTLQKIDEAQGTGAQGAQRDMFTYGQDLKRQYTSQLGSALNPMWSIPGQAAGIYGQANQALGGMYDSTMNQYGGLANWAGQLANPPDKEPTAAEVAQQMYDMYNPKPAADTMLYYDPNSDGYYNIGTNPADGSKYPIYVDPTTLKPEDMEGAKYRANFGKPATPAPGGQPGATNPNIPAGNPNYPSQPIQDNPQTQNDGSALNSDQRPVYTPASPQYIGDIPNRTASKVSGTPSVNYDVAPTHPAYNIGGALDVKNKYNKPTIGGWKPEPGMGINAGSGAGVQNRLKQIGKGIMTENPRTYYGKSTNPGGTSVNMASRLNTNSRRGFKVRF
jgi:hypothetical protein